MNTLLSMARNLTSSLKSTSSFSPFSSGYLAPCFITSESVNIKGYAYSIDGKKRASGSNDACGGVRAVLTNSLSNLPSETVPAYYDVWIEIYNLDFFTLYKSSITEGNGSVKWTDGYFNLHDINDKAWVRSTMPTSDITERGDANLILIR